MRFGDFIEARGYGFPEVRTDNFAHITENTEISERFETDGMTEIEYNFEVLLRNNVLVVTNNQLAYREKVATAFRKFMLALADGNEELAESISANMDERLQSGFVNYTSDFVAQMAVAIVEAKGEELDDL